MISSALLIITSLPFMIVVALLGLITGSFLNAVVHRLPRGISLLNPTRSFCPSCEKTIPWQENLPVVSWLLLRGRCSGCSMPIALRYPLVELLTAGLYLLAWEKYGLPLAPVFWIFLSFLVAATFIDIDHLIIPNEITKGGTVMGVASAIFFPELIGASVWWQGFLYSLLGAAGGYALLWGVVELGKKVFGRLRMRFEEGVLLELLNSDDGEKGDIGTETHRIFKLGEEELPLDEIFYRANDRVEATCSWVEIAGEHLGGGKLTVENEFVKFEGREWPIAELSMIRAEVSELVIPREAMGFGDVKFLACIGAFLGWKGVLFTLFTGSVIGALIGLLMMLFTGGRAGGRIPFGPYLAFGAALWVFAGPELVSLYFARVHLDSLTAFFLSSLRLPV